MALTPEAKAELWAELWEDLLGPMPMPKPKVVTRNDVGTVRDADVHVSRTDPNAADDQHTTISVRRPDYVTINIAEWDRQQEEKRQERLERHRLDPVKYGHWGPTDDDE